MISEKCPDCGAGVAPNATECSYCGSVLVPTNPVVKWTAIKDHLPPASPTDPSRSINVLGCFGMNGGFLKHKDGTRVDAYEGSLKSMYYDFKTQKWKNDFYGERAEPFSMTHWMPLPAADLPDWTPIVLRTPQVAGRNGWSIYVLGCNKNLDYAGSVFSVSVYLADGHWSAPLDTMNGSDDSPLGRITISHWMPQPDRPTG